MGNVAHLKTKGDGRERITVDVEEFSERIGQTVADAETVGARMVLLVLGVAPDKHMDILETLEVTHPTRSRQYGAQLKVLLRGIAK